MLKTITRFGLAGAIATLSFAAHAQQETFDISIFPQAKAGQIRHVFTLEPRENEANYKVEIFAGQVVSRDCNQVMIAADLEEEDLKGWGYSYYVVEDVKEPVQTLMACPEAEKREEIVGLNFGDDAFLRYNSKLPVVVYAPENLEVGYRLWHTDGEIRK